MRGRLVACPFCKSQTRVDDAAFEPRWPGGDQPDAEKSTEPASRPASTQPTTRQPARTEPAATKRKKSDDVQNGSKATESPVVREIPPKYHTQNEPAPTELCAIDLELPPKVIQRERDADLDTSESPDSDPLAKPKHEVAPDAEVAEADEAAKWLPPRFAKSQTADDAPATTDNASMDVFIVKSSVTRLEMSNEIVSVRALSRDEKDRRKKIRVAIVFGVGVVVLSVVFWLLHALAG